MEYVVLLYKYDVVEVGDLFVILHIYNKFLSYKKRSNKLFSDNGHTDKFYLLFEQEIQIYKKLSV